MKKSIQYSIILALFTGIFASCSTDIEIESDANQVIERVDIKISGDQDQYFYEQSLESDVSTDLVNYNYLGDASNTFAFEIQLEQDITLSVSIHDVSNAHPSTQVKSPFGVFAAQDVNTKRRYAIFEVTNKIGEMQVFTSNIRGNNAPNIDAFTIQEYDQNKKEILCRISNVKLFDQGGTDTPLTINGTFKGAITFE